MEPLQQGSTVRGTWRRDGVSLFKEGLETAAIAD